jgi:hypothetical protein
MKLENGWKPIPLSLKILTVVFLLWSIGTLFNLSNLYTNGLPLMGNFVYGISAISVAIFLDIIGPIIFIIALLKRKSWTHKWAFFYIGLFILNGVVAFFTVQNELGLPQILFPNIVSIIFLIVIFCKRSYFNLNK